MVAWNNAVLANTGAAYRAFLVQYPDSDLTATARKLEERLRNRPVFAASVAVRAARSPGSAGQPVNASLAAPTCPCTTPSQPLRKVDPPPPPKKRATKPPRLESEPVDDVVVYRRPPPRVYYEPMPGPSIGIGIGVGGYGGGGGRRPGQLLGVDDLALNRLIAPVVGSHDDSGRLKANAPERSRFRQGRDLRRLENARPGIV